LGRKARDPNGSRTDRVTPRVISPQNRTHITQSPRRALLQPV